MLVKKILDKNTKSKLEQKVKCLSEYKNIPENIAKYLEYVQKWLSEIIDFSAFETIDEKSAFDILYLIWLWQSFVTNNWEARNTTNDANETVYNNIQSWFVKEGYSPEMAKKCTDIIISYVNDKSIVDLLLNEKSVLLLWQKWYIENMDKIYANFFDNKQNLLEKWINYAPKWKEWCYTIVYQYDKEFSDKISSISHRIWEFIKKKKGEWLIDESFDFIEYSSDNIHTSLLTTPATQNFVPNMNNLEDISNALNETQIISFNAVMEWIKINENSIIIATHPKDAVFLENLKLALGNVPKNLNIWWTRWSHITIWRFVWKINDESVLWELYDFINKYSDSLKESNYIITPERITIWYLNVNTEYNNCSYFEIFPVKNKYLDN